MNFRRSDGVSTLANSGEKTKFTDIKPLITSQIAQCFRAGLFQNPGTPTDKQTYTDSLWNLINKNSLPEFIPKVSADHLPFALVLPRTFLGCKLQMERIETTTNGRVQFNEFGQTIVVKIDEREIIFSKVDFSDWYRAIGSNQSCWPYLIFGPASLENLEENFSQYSAEEILAIIFHSVA
ncbi:MAG: hypothetical protein WC582_00145 [Patescibacteria group bacterium]